jgi:hypothetical protein
MIFLVFKPEQTANSDGVCYVALDHIASFNASAIFSTDRTCVELQAGTYQALVETLQRIDKALEGRNEYNDYCPMMWPVELTSVVEAKENESLPKE